MPTGFSGEPPSGPAMPVMAIARSASKRCRAPLAISAADSAETAPCALSVSWRTPRRFSFAALAYVTTAPRKYSLEPGTSVSMAETRPPVQDSANPIVFPPVAQQPADDRREVFPVLAEDPVAESRSEVLLHRLEARLRDCGLATDGEMELDLAGRRQDRDGIVLPLPVYRARRSPRRRTPPFRRHEGPGAVRPRRRPAPGGPGRPGCRRSPSSPKAPRGAPRSRSLLAAPRSRGPFRWDSRERGPRR